MILAGGTLFSGRLQFPGAIVMVPVAGTAAVLVSGAATRSAVGVSALLEQPVLQWTGRLSYSWYLWHWPALVMVRGVVPHLSIWGGILTVAGALLLAALAHYTIENPVRYSRVLAAKPRNSLALALALSLLGACLALAVHHSSSQAARTPEQAAFATAQNDIDPLMVACLARASDGQLRECVLGQSHSNTTVVLFGDSHAAHWLPALQRVGASRGWRVLTLLKAGCPAASARVINPRVRRFEAVCPSWREKALSRIVALRPQAVLIGESVQYVKGRGGAEDALATLSFSEWGQGLRRTLEILDNAGLRTVLLRDAPRLGFDVPTCLSRVAAHPRLYSESQCSVSAATALSEGVWHTEVNATQQLSHVSALDLSKQFCAGLQCPSMLNGVVVYWDADHITASFSSRLAPILSQGLAWSVDAE
jgi:hypothetical protein